jgi:Uma2 family endonuclease
MKIDPEQVERRGLNMCATAAKTRDTILMFDVPWETYDRLINALEDHRFRHTYQEGTLEVFSPILYGVDWRMYERILRAFGDRRFPHTYQEGTLEIMMSPSERHEEIKEFLGYLIKTTAIECGFWIRSTGSATRRDKSLMQGLEPDQSYFIVKKPPGKSPAADKTLPNLVVEVDLRQVAARRLESYAALGVSEVWRYRKGHVDLLGLSESRRFDILETSVILPLLTTKDVNRFLERMLVDGEAPATREFIAWLRKRIKKPARRSRKKES